MTDRYFIMVILTSWVIQVLALVFCAMNKNYYGPELLHGILERTADEVYTERYNIG